MQDGTEARPFLFDGPDVKDLKAQLEALDPELKVSGAACLGLCTLRTVTVQVYNCTILTMRDVREHICIKHMQQRRH
jgi:hypothetical protein